MGSCVGEISFLFVIQLDFSLLLHLLINCQIKFRISMFPGSVIPWISREQILPHYSFLISTMRIH